MHVVVNTLSVTPSRGGVKTFVLNLLDGLLAQDEEKKLTLLCSEQNEQLFAPYEQRWACVERDILPLRVDQPAFRIFYDQVVVPLHCRRYPDAVLLSQASTSSLATTLPEVVIVQVPLSVRSIRNEVPSEADNTSWSQRLYYDGMLPLTLWRADEVVAVSNHLRGKIADLYPRFAHKVRTVHEGVNLDTFTANPWDKQGESQEATSYLLFVSTLFPYKRADQAIRAFARVVNRDERRSLRLKLAGKDPNGETQRLRQIAQEEQISDRVDILGVVPHDQMAELYRGAEALLYPSTVETFGLPVLEAMACGTPVIASDRMSVPEIVGDAGVIVDPDDTGAFADTIRRLLDNEALQEDLRAAGKERAQSFTWDRTARGVWKALKDAKRTSTT